MEKTRRAGFRQRDKDIENELSVLLAELSHREAEMQYRVAHQDKLYLTGYTTLATVSLAAIAVNAVGDTLEERLTDIHPFSFLLVAIVLLWIPVTSTVGVVTMRLLSEYISHVLRPRVATLLAVHDRGAPDPLGWPAYYRSNARDINRRNFVYHVGSLFREGILAAPSVAVFGYYLVAQSPLVGAEARGFELLLVGIWLFGLLSPVILMTWARAKIQPGDTGAGERSKLGLWIRRVLRIRSKTQ